MAEEVVEERTRAEAVALVGEPGVAERLLDRDEKLERLLRRADAAGLLDYGRSLELPAGGFRGGLWDGRTDAEYTFYGLALCALL